MERETVLIADDEPHYLEWLEDFLTATGYDVEFYDNVNRAYTALSKRLYRAVIVDLNIPALGTLKDDIDRKGAPYMSIPVYFWLTTQGTKDTAPARLSFIPSMKLHLSRKSAKSYIVTIFKRTSIHISAASDGRTFV